MRARLVVAGALLCLLATIPLLSGCGGGDTLSADGVAKAADATVARGGAKIAVQSQADVPGAGQLTLTGGGAVDARARTGSTP
jgi:hypothetical protein